MLTLASNIQLVKAEATTIIVPDDYPTIQEAINNANEGDIIYVRAGMYKGHVVVNKAVSLIGENSVTTIIDGGWFRSSVEVLMDNVTIAGFNIRNSRSAYRFAGVALQSVKFCNVSWNILTGNFDGIYAEYSLNNTFCHNFILGNSWNGVHLKYDCRYNSIAFNTILNSRIGIGLEASSISNSILCNHIAECEWHGILTYCSSNSIIGNTITNCFTGMYLSEEMSVIYHNNFIGNTYQITCYSAPNIWDNGYPSGGNYWGSSGVDEYSGPYQNETGSDGISDYALVIDAGNIDHYPLMKPWGVEIPAARFTWVPSIPKVGKPVTFDASSSTPNGGTMITYEWDFGDGEYACGQIVTHMYSSEGDYTVTLYVIDSEGLWDAEQKLIQAEFEIQPYGAQAEFTATPETTTVGESVKFDASASLSGWNGTHEMSITEYRWDFGYGIKKTTSTPILYYSFISPGIYYVTLTVYAPGATPETDSTTKKVTITAIPVGGYSFPIEGYTTSKPLTLYLTLVAIFAAVFTLIKCKTRRSSKQLEQTL